MPADPSTDPSADPSTDPPADPSADPPAERAMPSAAARVRAGQALAVKDFAAWRTAARDLLLHGVAPEAVTWDAPHTDARAAGGDLLTRAPPAEAQHPAPVMPAGPQHPAPVMPAGPQHPAPVMPAGPQHPAPVMPAGPQATLPSRPPPQPPPRIPRALMDMLQSAACCRVPDRWAFLYRVIWRWQQGQHEVQSPADQDGARLHAMVKAVRREEHDMHAYIRFRERPPDAGAPRFVAWYEPRHDVLPQVAEHFARRMGKVSWMIATPEASVLWDGHTLHHAGPLVHKADDLDDDGEVLWLTYYRSIFNPARLNTGVMRQHIGADRWKNLPEGKIVPQMVSAASLGARRVGQLEAVGQRKGTTIPILPEDAQPERQQPSTLDACRRCELYRFATQAVPGEGPKHAHIMLVGEQPGDQEDLAGEPFVGPAGKLLDQVCAAAGIDRQNVYVTNAVKHFKWEPRGKRRLHKTPAQREVEACHYWLDKELASVAPTVIVALGATALKSVLGTAAVTLKHSLGKPLRHEGRWVVTTYHPSYVLRVPGEDAKREAFAIMVQGLKLAQALLARPAEEAPASGHP